MPTTPTMPTTMAILNVRNLPEGTHARLRVRAAEHGRSMEAEARAILVEACGGSSRGADAASLPAWVDRLYGGNKPANAVERLIAERRREAKSE